MGVVPRLEFLKQKVLPNDFNSPSLYADVGRGFSCKCVPCLVANGLRHSKSESISIDRTLESGSASHDHTASGNRQQHQRG